MNLQAKTNLINNLFIAASIFVVFASGAMFVLGCSNDRQAVTDKQAETIRELQEDIRELKRLNAKLRELEETSTQPADKTTATVQRYMSFENLIPIIMERSTAMFTLWSIYIAVVGAILGYLAATATTSSSPAARLLMIFGFVFFAWGNHSALSSVLEQHDELVAIARKKIPPGESWDKILDASGPRDGPLSLSQFHLTLDFLIVAIIWLMPVILVKMRPIFQFHNKSISPIKSRLSPAAVSWDQRNEQWNLVDNYEAKTEKTVYSIPAGFEFDLASIPKSLWWAVGPFELSVVAPLVHDFIYRYNGKMPPSSAFDHENNPVISISRADADLAFLELMQMEGVSWFRRTIAYYAVHFFGAKHWVSK